MTKILKSKYALLKNFEEDITGRFLFKMKRREITRKLLSFSKILNKVEPLRLTDLLIRRKKKIRGLVSYDNFLNRKFKYFYSMGLKGKTRSFVKLQYKSLQKNLRNRFMASICFLEARLDVLLVRLRLFDSVISARIFIKTEGVLINKKLIKNFKFCLSKGDILSFTHTYSIFLKRKIYRLSRARPFKLPLKNLVNLELNSILTMYTWLFKRYTGMSPLLLLGFPRYIEPNFNSMEFYFYGSIVPEDIYYPFKTSLQNRIAFFNNCI